MLITRIFKYVISCVLIGSLLLLAGCEKNKTLHTVDMSFIVVAQTDASISVVAKENTIDAAIELVSIDLREGDAQSIAFNIHNNGGIEAITVYWEASTSTSIELSDFVLSINGTTHIVEKPFAIFQNNIDNTHIKDFGSMIEAHSTLNRGTLQFDLNSLLSTSQ